MEVSELSSVADAVTFTLSMTAPGLSVKSTRAVWPTSSLISAISSTEKPFVVARSVYRPTGRLGNVYKPVSLEEASRRRPVSRLVTTTCAAAGRSRDRAEAAEPDFLPDQRGGARGGIGGRRHGAARGPRLGLPVLSRSRHVPGAGSDGARNAAGGGRGGGRSGVGGAAD